MNPKELRIGNYVDRNGLMEITGIKDSIFHGVDPGLYIYDHVNKMYPKHLFPISSFKGIPLTEEWLIKFGFVNTDSEIDYIEFEKHHVPIGNDGGLDGIENSHFYFEFGDNFSKKYIKYVHELQNLVYVLTGEELTIQIK